MPGPVGGDLAAAVILGDQNLLMVKKFDPTGALVVDRPVIGPSPPETTSSPLPAIPPLRPAGIEVSASFRQALELRGTTSAAFDTGVFSGGFTAEGRLGFSHSGAASVGIGPNGIDASGSLEVFVGAEGRLTGSLSTPLGAVSGGMSASASMYAAAVGNAHIGLDGIQGSFSAQAVIAAKAGASGAADLGFATGRFGAEAGVGLGAEFGVDGEISVDRIGFGLDAEVGLGVLLGADVDLSFSPSGLVDDLEGAVDDPVGAIGDILDLAQTVSGRNVDSAGDLVLSTVVTSATGAPGVVAVVAAEVIGEGFEAVGHALEDVPVAGEIVGFISDVGDVVDDGLDAVGSLLPWNW